MDRQVLNDNVKSDDGGNTSSARDFDDRAPRIVSANNVSFVYRAGKSIIHAINKLNWFAEQGKITTIIGPSGCGKSTLLRGICGSLQPDTGKLDVLIPDRPSVRDIAVTFQTPALLPWLSIEANALLPFKLCEVVPSEVDKMWLNQLLDKTALDQFRFSYPHQLSGGMAMRAAVLRAFLPRPKLVLMDEPFAALDELNRERMCELLEQIWLETKNTVIFVTHNLTEAVLLSDRVSVFSPRPGRIIEDVTITIPRPRAISCVHGDEFQSIVSRLRNVIRREQK